MKQFSFAVLLAALLSGAIACRPTVSTKESSPPSSTGLPGEGITVKPVHSTILEERFRTEVVNKGLEKLGYEIDKPEEIDPPILFLALANGDADYSTIHWERLHAEFYEKNGGDEKLEKMGLLISETVLGYQIDKKTADEHNITHIDQLKDPEIAKLFDRDRNGKANLTGCNPGWGCELVIEHHLDAYDLRETVEHDQGLYMLLIADTITRYKEGESVLFITWTPLWLGEVLKPDEDTIWLEVPYTDLPEKHGNVSEKDTTFKGKNLGFIVDRVRIVANKKFISANPSAKRLFELINIPVEDINTQNLRMREGEDSIEDVIRHADEWIAENQDTFDGWIEEALQVKSEN